MPIYEYQCKKCKSHFEKRQSVSEEPLKKCENCGGELEKQWSLSGFQFKGEGWYVSDYAAKKDKGKESSTESGEKSSPVGSTTAADSASNNKGAVSEPAKTEKSKTKD
ncbi:MAG: zinc ribbon domain-containing protein [Acidobacteriota bacterium]